MWPRFAGASRTFDALARHVEPFDKEDFCTKAALKDRLREQIVGIIPAQHGQGLGAGLGLESAGVLPLRHLRVHVGASQLEHRHELLVRSQGVLRVLQGRLVAGALLGRLRQLLGLGVDLVRSRGDLVILRGLQLRESGDGVGLVLMGVVQFRLGQLFHVAHDAEDLARGAQRRRSSFPAVSFRRLITFVTERFVASSDLVANAASRGTGRSAMGFVMAETTTSTAKRDADHMHTLQP